MLTENVDEIDTCDIDLTLVKEVKWSLVKQNLVFEAALRD